MSESLSLHTPREDPAAPMRRLKALPAPERARILELLTARTYADARSDVEKIAGCECPVSTLSRFFRWQSREDGFEESRDLLEQVNTLIPEGERDQTLDGILDAGLDSLLAQSAARGESKIFIAGLKLLLAREREDRRNERMKLAVRQAARADRSLALQEEKLKVMKRRKLTAGTHALIEEFNGHPETRDKLLRVLREFMGTHAETLRDDGFWEDADPDGRTKNPEDDSGLFKGGAGI